MKIYTNLDTFPLNPRFQHFPGEHAPELPEVARAYGAPDESFSAVTVSRLGFYIIFIWKASSCEVIRYVAYVVDTFSLRATYTCLCVVRHFGIFFFAVLRY